ncbi:MAG: hypothetical protein KDK97_19380 [Verrucomicrobiales bacterium]|nr:hypothetical protein [Verrucomicrobiales bacterium]MCP5556450.1 cytochrome-c peroxidase [Verrucomicrobiaceae bacterium]
MNHFPLRCICVALLSGRLLAVEAAPDQTISALPKSAALAADTPQQVELGRLLFFDPILSATREVACATCHHPDHGWADGRSTPLGVNARGLGPKRKVSKSSDLAPLLRNTPTILNTAFNGIENTKSHDPQVAPMFWDNRVQSLESQALVPIESREEMRGDACSKTAAVPQMVERLKAIPEYQKRFATEITGPRVAQAIAAYERTLITPDSPFDRFIRGDPDGLTVQQKAGMQAFQKAGCALCHNGPMLSDFKLHSIGITDSASPRADFRTPSLRNLRHTAPYMHNGGLMTLEQVLLFYDRLSDQVSETLDGGDASSLPPLDPLLQKLNLLPEDHGNIISFLGALSADDYDRLMPDRVPSGLSLPGRDR